MTMVSPGLRGTRGDTRDSAHGQHISSVRMLRHYVLVRSDFEVRRREQARLGRIYRDVNAARWCR